LLHQFHEQLSPSVHHVPQSIGELFPYASAK
jgi:hypothetical protein